MYSDLSQTEPEMGKINDLFKTVVILLFLISSTGLGAEEQADKNENVFFWSLATKGFYSTGLTDSYFYNRTSGKGEYRSEYIDVSVSVQRYFHYQLTDGNSDYEYRSFNEAGLGFTAYLFRIISFTGGYYRGDDFNDFKKNDYDAGIEFDFSSVILAADCSYEQLKYDLNSVPVETIIRDCSIQAEYAITDNLSADLWYIYSTTYFNTLENDYTKNIIRAGFSDIFTENFFILGGLTVGKDSADYYIYGADIGLTYNIFTNIKVSLLYIFNYYSIETTSESDSSSTKGNGYGYGSGSTNPYVSSDNEGESFAAQSVSLGITFTF